MACCLFFELEDLLEFQFEFVGLHGFWEGVVDQGVLDGFSLIDRQLALILEPSEAGSFEERTFCYVAAPCGIQRLVHHGDS